MNQIREMKDYVKKIMMFSEVKEAASCISNYDPSLLLHCNGVAVMAGLMAQDFKLPHEVITEVIKGALVHDYGKTLLGKELLNKAEPLTEQELKSVRDHPRLGYEYLRDEPGFSDVVLDIVLHHHETENGSGYPDGCTQMHLETKIVSMADIYNAISSYRAYRRQEMSRLDIVKQMEVVSKKFSDGEKLLNALLNVAFSERV